MIEPIKSGKTYKIAWFGIPYAAQVISTSGSRITFKLIRPTGKVETMTARPGVFRMWIAAGAKVKSSRRYQMNPKRRNNANTRRREDFSAEAKKFMDFTGKLEARVKKQNISWPKKLIAIGESTDITYRSDKQVGALKGGVKRDYIHSLKKHGRIFVNPEGTMIVIMGLKINLKKEGIVG